MNAELATALIRERLSPRRFKHSVQVAELAREMATDFGIDGEKAYLTGILHDCAKGISGDELLRIAEANGLIEDEVERRAPDLLHAPVGAFLLARDYGVGDVEILDAVRFHTLGNSQMSLLAKIIFLADAIEPGRDYPGVDQLRCVARRDLDRGIILSIDSTIKYCIDHDRPLHPRGIEVRNTLLLRRERESRGLADT